VHKMALARGNVFVVAEDVHVIVNDRMADFRDAHAGRHTIGKSGRCKVIALCFNHQTNHRTATDVECTVGDQEVIHHCVKPTVINNVSRLSNLTRLGYNLPRYRLPYHARASCLFVHTFLEALERKLDTVGHDVAGA
jgi:hypothetical protein